MSEALRGDGLIARRGARRLRWMGIATALVVGSLPAAARAAGHPVVPALHVLATYEVPGEPSMATDVRWAGDRSVYLERYYDGVDELSLAPGLPRVRQVVPSGTILGDRRYKSFSRLAASEGFLAFADWIDAVAWRSLARRPDETVRFERKPMDFIEDLDLAGDRLLVLGAMAYHEEPGNPFSPDGAVAFLGSARQGSEQVFRPVLFDPAGPGAPHLLHCATAALGAARFLPDGSFFILPGFQPGAHLFNREGMEIRTWNTALLGLNADADCASMTVETRNQTLLNHPELRTRWLNRHRIVDEVLPLPSGPGVVIRSVEAGAVRWELDVLEAQGIRAYEIPIAGATVYNRLRGDYRNGRIVFAVVDDSLRPESKKGASQLVVMQLPRG